MLPESLALPLLDRLRRSPYGGPWLAGAWLGIEADDLRILASPTAILPWAAQPVDATLRMSRAALEAMLAGEAPPGTVGFVLGDREETPARLKQARAAMALAALGWGGPWPHAGADPAMIDLTRRAALDLALGPADRFEPLFPPSAPAELARLLLRVTDGARVRRCTLGLSDAPGAPEFWTDDEPKLLRVAALSWLEAGTLPSSLESPLGALRFVRAPLPLPHGIAALVRVHR